MQFFETSTPTSVSRRSFLVMPFAFAGLIALYSSKDNPLPHVAESGSGDEVTLTLFDDSGRLIGEKRAKKIVKTDAEWQAQQSCPN